MSDRQRSYPFGPPPGRMGREIEEEQPSMRSVAIMGAPSAAADPFGSPALLGRGPPLPKMGLPASLKNGGGGGLGGLKAAPVAARPERTRSKNRRDEFRTWKVTSVESLPDDFPLERTSRHIPDADAPEVSARISHCLRERSIQAKYDDTKATAKCRTPDYVSFKISLFGGQDDVDGGIIVEVQRRKGSSHCFMKDCRAVLSAAEGDAAEIVEEETMIFLKRPVSEMACLQGVQVSDDEVDQVMEAPKSLLSSEKYDSHMLGMESVEKLTDPLHAAPEVVVLAAKSVVLPEDSSEIRDSVSKLLQHGCLRPDEVTMTGPEGDNDFNEEMHHLALSVVLNAVRATAEDGSLTEAVAQQREWFSQVLIPVLVHDLTRGEDQAHDARMAAQCLNSLLRCSPFAKELVIGAGAAEALEQAQDYAMNNAALQNEVAQGLELISHQ